MIETRCQQDASANGGIASQLQSTRLVAAVAELRSFDMTRIHTAQHRNLPSPIIWAPLVFGCLGLVLSAAYEAQRSGAFLRSFYALDRFIQHHLDGVAEWSSLCAIVGVVGGGRRAVTAGILVSIAALLWSSVFLSL